MSGTGRIQPNMGGGWITGRITWGAINGVTNVIQVTTNCNGLGPVTWWRNENPGESFRNACIAFFANFPFAAMGTTVASCIAGEWSPNGKVHIQEVEFSFDNMHINLDVSE